MSIDAQRRELRDLAKKRGCVVTAEFTDSVESGKDEHRPGFQKLLTALRDSARGWTAIYMLDTSRLARNQFVAHFFRHECARRNVEVVFAKTPELDGISGIILPAVLHAMDEVHSYLSREKGLAGMAENVRGGFRAGGRAPIGYVLHANPTGATREGVAVTKSTLLPDAVTAPKLAAFLKHRAEGIPRKRAAELAGLDEHKAPTLIGYEWNALTYAGHTVWGVQAARASKGGAYIGGRRRKLRKDWLIQHNTHAALITDGEAETLLSRLETGYAARAPRRSTRSDALLAGLLRTPDGRVWHSDGEGNYRLGKGRRVGMKSVDAAVMRRTMTDLQSPSFVKAITRTARASAKALSSGNDDVQAMRTREAGLTRKIARLVDLCAELENAAPNLRRIDELERERIGVVDSLHAAELAQRSVTAMAEINEHEVRAVLVGLAARIEDRDTQRARDALHGLIDTITLDPDSLDCEVRYHITGVKLASPRDSNLNPDAPSWSVKMQQSVDLRRRRA